MATLTGKLESILTEAVESGSIVIALCGYGPQVPRLQGQSLLARVTTQEIEAGSNGTFTAEVPGNDEIAPAGTYYTVTVKNDNGDVVQTNAYLFLDDQTYDLDSTEPFDPTQPIPPLPPLIINQLQILPPLADMVFDGSTYTAFKLTLPGNISTVTIENMIPGNLYTFIIVQDATGNHLFPWPANVHNAPTVDPQANSTTIQTFVADENGELWAIGPSTYYP
jgi:hypothetical protein